MKQGLLVLIGLLIVSCGAYADLVLDDFDDDRSPENGAGLDAFWNPPPAQAFTMELETAKVYAGTGALKVSWTNKDMWIQFVIGKLERADNMGKMFLEADTLRIAVAGASGNIILKMADANGNSTGDLYQVQNTSGDNYKIVEFPYYQAMFNSAMDLEKISELWFLIDAGKRSTGTAYIDSIELTAGSGAGAELVATIDNFDNDTSLADDPNAPDSVPWGAPMIPGPFVTSVVNDPAGGDNAVLKVDYNTSAWNVLWVEQLDVADWSRASQLSIDVYGSANDILLKLYQANGTEEEPSGGLKDHSGNQWDTFTWGLENVSSVDLSQMGKLIVFVEGPSGGTGTVYFDNLKLVGEITDVANWALY